METGAAGPARPAGPHRRGHHGIIPAARPGPGPRQGRGYYGTVSKAAAAAHAAHAAPAARASLSTAAAIAFGGGVDAGRGYLLTPETVENPSTEDLEAEDGTPETSSTPGGDTPEPETVEKPRREMIADHVEVPICVPVEENHPRARVYGQRGQELPAAARPKSGKLPRTGPPQGRPRGGGPPAEIRKFSRQVRRR